MKTILPLLLFLALPARAQVPVITTEDVTISDPKLVAELAKIVKKSGLLTSTKQGIDSYMVAVLCEYPHKGERQFAPYCVLRKVKKPEDPIQK